MRRQSDRLEDRSLNLTGSFTKAAIIFLMMSVLAFVLFTAAFFQGTSTLKSLFFVSATILTFFALLNALKIALICRSKLGRTNRIFDFLSGISVKNTDSLMESLLDTALALIPECDRGSVAIAVAEDNRIWRFAAVKGYSNRLLDLRVNPEHLYPVSNKVQEIERVWEYNQLMPEEIKRVFEASGSRDIVRSLAVGIGRDDKIIGSFFLDTTKDVKFSNDSKRILQSLALISSIIVELNHSREKELKYRKEAMRLLLSILEARDSYTHGHSERVARTAALIARKLGLKEDEVNHTYWAGILHDIGKLVIPENILKKPGPLTSEEWQIIKQHPEHGEDFVKRFTALGHLAIFIRHHHERYDGSGYPDNLMADSIPVISRIIAVADAFDAMLSVRVYKPSLKIEEAIDELKRGAGTQFDPTVVKAFLELEEVIKSRQNKVV